MKFTVRCVVRTRRKTAGPGHEQQRRCWKYAEV